MINERQGTLIALIAFGISLLVLPLTSHKPGTTSEWLFTPNSNALHLEDKEAWAYFSTATIAKICGDGTKIYQTGDGKFWIREEEIWRAGELLPVKDQTVCP